MSILFETLRFWRNPLGSGSDLRECVSVMRVWSSGYDEKTTTWNRRMQINIKRIYDEPARSDGKRILVDRLWPRGVSKEKARLHLWLKEIAPSTGLRKWFDHDPKKWAVFKKKYQAELKANTEAVSQLKKIAKEGTVTLLYGARDEKHNEALVIMDYIIA